MELRHHGGHQGVTGSCHQLVFDSGQSVLVDCGLFQGSDANRHPDLEIEFPLTGVIGLLLTHVHLDHVGRLPYLMAAGYEGPIYCTQPTAKLLPLTIEDALKIGFTRNTRMIEAFLDTLQTRLKPLPYHQWTDLGNDVQVRLQPAGHILGSCYVEIQADDRRAVFSGDLGAPHAPLMKVPDSPERADLLVLESTYGDRHHQGRAERQQTLERVLRKTLENKGVTIIPAFSLGRTQELLFEMNMIFERVQSEQEAGIMKRVDVIVDSPLACRFTEIYNELQPYWDQEAQQVLRYDDQPLVFENLTSILDHEEHSSTLDYLERSDLPAIVVAGSGMCTGGRVVNYLKRFISDPKADVVFIGYQGHGTPGREIQAGHDKVRLDGTVYPVRAAVHSISGYSAHADQADLLRFVTEMPSPPGEVVLVHGEDHAKRILCQKLRDLGITVRG
ncbi:MBL fold metallo-hydrolase [Roseiconus nitratireducens]|uniref:MBL fold metallo-hydrolase n=1 Tax=Roseiconus nitratireducens TaxID=2605748 RepID=A0A5M6D593_9BACT|nr:MBL fold metallo-hydrolase [Roseiconus nitratireducens]KAA5541472.1 MBL fold metallo-hydrolase [Roseiconus nitratireducens]